MIGVTFSSSAFPHLADDLNKALKDAAPRFELGPGRTVRIGGFPATGPHPVSLAREGRELRFAVDPARVDLTARSLPRDLLVLVAGQSPNDGDGRYVRATSRTSLADERYPGWRIRASRYPDLVLPPNVWLELRDREVLEVQARYGLDDWRTVAAVRVDTGCRHPQPHTVDARTPATLDANLLVSEMRDALEVERLAAREQLTSAAGRLAVLAYLRLHMPQVTLDALKESYLDVRKSTARSRIRSAKHYRDNEFRKDRFPVVLELAARIDGALAGGGQLRTATRLGDIDWGPDAPWTWVDPLIRIGVYRLEDFPGEWMRILERSAYDEGGDR